MTTHETTITVRALRAAILIAAKDDARYYLNGVFVDLARGALVSTDGHSMFIVRLGESDWSPIAPVQCDSVHGAALMQRGFIIPRELADAVLRAVAAVKGKAAKPRTLTWTYEPAAFRLSVTVNGQTIAGSAVQGTFPEYGRIIPRSVSGARCSLDPYKVATMADAFAALVDPKYPQHIAVHMNGDGPAILARLDCADAFGIVMPMRHELRSDADLARLMADVLREPGRAPAADAVAAAA